MLGRIPLFAAAAVVIASTCSPVSAVTYPYWVPYSFGTRISGVSLLVESIDDLTYGGGTLYFVDNNLGGGALYKLSGGSLTYAPTSNPYIGLPRGLALSADGTKLYAGSNTFYGSYSSGVLQFDAATLGYVKNAIPFAAPAPGHRAVSDLAFGPAGYLYVAGENAVTRYQGSTLQKDASYSVSIPTNGSRIGFCPGTTDMFITAGPGNDGIDEYNLTGNFVRTYIPAGTHDLGDITDFVFGTDGSLYIIDCVRTYNPSTVTNHLFTFDSLGNFVISSIISGQGGYTPVGIDPQPTIFVPEPASLALLSLAVPVLFRRRRK